MEQSLTKFIAQRFILIAIAFVAFIFMFTTPAEAQRGRRSKSSVTRKVSRTNSNNACYTLYKKRTSSQNREVIASNARRPKKYKPMAETDGPVKSNSNK